MKEKTLWGAKFTINKFNFFWPGELPTDHAIDNYVIDKRLSHSIADCFAELEKLDTQVNEVVEIEEDGELFLEFRSSDKFSKSYKAKMCPECLSPKYHHDKCSIGIAQEVHDA